MYYPTLLEKKGGRGGERGWKKIYFLFKVGLGFRGWTVHFYLKVEDGRGAWVLFIHFLLLLYFLQLFVFVFVIFSNSWRGMGGIFFSLFVFFLIFTFEGGRNVGFNFFHFLLLFYYLKAFYYFCLFLKGKGGMGFFFLFFYSWREDVGVGFTFSFFVNVFNS